MERERGILSVKIGKSVSRGFGTVVRSDVRSQKTEEERVND